MSLEEIRKRWESKAWPMIGYFVHGQAYSDIKELERHVTKFQDDLREAFKAGFECSAQGWNGEHCEDYEKLPEQIEEEYQKFHERYYGSKTEDKD